MLMNKLKLKIKKKTKKPTTPWATQRLEVGPNDANTTPPKIGFV